MRAPPVPSVAPSTCSNFHPHQVKESKAERKKAASPGRTTAVAKTGNKGQETWEASKKMRADFEERLRKRNEFLSHRCVYPPAVAGGGMAIDPRIPTTGMEQSRRVFRGVVRGEGSLT